MGAAIGGPFAPITAGVLGIIGGGTGYYYGSEAGKKYLIDLVNNLIMLKKKMTEGLLLVRLERLWAFIIQLKRHKEYFKQG